MTKDQRIGSVEKALASMQQHGQSLKAVNEKLTDLIASLRGQKQRLAERSRAGAPPGHGGGVEPAAISTPNERALLAELATAREALRLGREERERIGERLAEIERENRRLCDGYESVQQQNSDLVNLYTVLERLHAAPGRAEALEAIGEIVVAMVGSEEAAIFELSLDGHWLVPVHAFGLDAERVQEIAVGSGTLGRVVAQGTSFFALEGDSVPEDPELTACVPLRLGDEVAGALAVYRLVGHKRGLTDLDREIFALLARHAAPALHASAVRRYSITVTPRGRA